MCASVRMRVVLSFCLVLSQWATSSAQQPVQPSNPKETSRSRRNPSFSGPVGPRGPSYDDSDEDTSAVAAPDEPISGVPAESVKRAERETERRAPSIAPRVAGGSSGKFLIGPDDTVTIVALNVDEINKSWRVGGLGDLNLPMIGRVHAAGLTVEQLENELATRLKPYVLDPHVTVFVSEFRSQPVTVTGDVLTPGTTQLQGPKNLFQVLMGAGGPSDKAATVKLARRRDQGTIPLPNVTETQSGSYSVVQMSIKDINDVRTPESNLVIKPFDVITVARERSPKLVHIIGEAARPGAVELITQDTVSLLQLVAVSGGLTRAANPSRTRIIHLGSDGKTMSTSTINLKQIMAGKAEDRRLQPGDVVVVPSSALKAYLETASLSALTTGMYILQRF